MSPVDDNEVEMRGRVLEHDIGKVGDWSPWSRFVLQPGSGLTGEGLAAVAASVRDSIAPDCLATTRLSRQVNGPDGKAIRTVQYEFRTIGDGRRWKALGDQEGEGG